MPNLIYILIIATIILLLSRPLAIYVGLVDKPNHRKFHKNPTPLIGGISIVITIVIYLLLNPNILPKSNIFIFCIVALAITGSLDDKYNLPVQLRLCVQALVATIFLFNSGLSIGSIYPLILVDNTLIQYIDYMLTAIVVIVLINAYNMSDGIDGSLSVITFTPLISLTLLFYINHQINMSYLCIIIIASMIPYALLNANMLLINKKVFIGDAGSMTIGFILTWLSLIYGVNKENLNQDSTIFILFYLSALPLIDLLSVCLFRIQSGLSPFKADRNHLHHVLLDAGLSEKKTLQVILFLSICFSGLGILINIYKVPIVVTIPLTIATIMIYIISLNKIRNVSKK